MKVRRARWKDEREYLGRGDGWVGAEKTSREGGLRQMSVPAGEERLKGGTVVVFVAYVIIEAAKGRVRK